MTREEAKVTLEGWQDGCSYTDEQLSNAIETAIEALEQSEIIHCKDCKYWKEAKWPDGKSYGIFCERTHYERKPDDFCSQAEVNL